MTEKIKRQRVRKTPNVKNDQTEITSWDYNPPIFFYERLSPKSDAELMNMGRELVNWAKLPTSIVFSNFFNQRELPINMRDFYEVAARFEPLQAAIQLAKQMLAGRREEGGITWKYNFNAIKETQPLYDPEYKVWKLEAISNTAANVEKIIVMPAIPKPEDV